MLTILGIVGIIICTYQAYKSARDYGRNTVVWPLLTFAIGFGLQWVLPFFIGLVLAIVWMASGVPADQIQTKILGPAILITIVSLVLSFVGMGLTLKFVSRAPVGREIPATKPASSLGLND